MIFETIKNALVKQLEIESEIINEDSYIEKDLELDSTENVVISLELKKKYGVEYVFPKEDVTLGEICKSVEVMMSDKISG